MLLVQKNESGDRTRDDDVARCSWCIPKPASTSNARTLVHERTIGRDARAGAVVTGSKCVSFSAGYMRRAKRGRDFSDCSNSVVAMYCAMM